MNARCRTSARVYSSGHDFPVITGEFCQVLRDGVGETGINTGDDGYPLGIVAYQGCRLRDEPHKTGARPLDSRHRLDSAGGSWRSHYMEARDYFGRLGNRRMRLRNPHATSGDLHPNEVLGLLLIVGGQRRRVGNDRRKQFRPSERPTCPQKLIHS
jgi:hypothetical protein